MKRDGKLLIDGGVTNNFPVSIAKEQYPHDNIIGISLNKYHKNPKVKNLFDLLTVSFEILMRKDIEKEGALANYFFSRELDAAILELNTKKLEKLFMLGYQDGMEGFSK